MSLRQAASDDDDEEEEYLSDDGSEFSDSSDDVGGVLAPRAAASEDGEYDEEEEGSDGSASTAVPVPEGEEGEPSPGEAQAEASTAAPQPSPGGPEEGEIIDWGATEQPEGEEDALDDEDYQLPPPPPPRGSERRKTREEPKPYDVPKSGPFYMHDDRMADDGGVAPARGPRVPVKKLYDPADDEKWVHDKFEMLSLAPEHDTYQGFLATQQSRAAARRGGYGEGDDAYEGSTRRNGFSRGGRERSNGYSRNEHAAAPRHEPELPPGYEVPRARARAVPRAQQAPDDTADYNEGSRVRATPRKQRSPDDRAEYNEGARTRPPPRRQRSADDRAGYNGGARRGYGAVDNGADDGVAVDADYDRSNGREYGAAGSRGRGARARGTGREGGRGRGGRAEKGTPTSVRQNPRSNNHATFLPENLDDDFPVLGSNPVKGQRSGRGAVRHGQAEAEGTTAGWWDGSGTQGGSGNNRRANGVAQDTAEEYTPAQEYVPAPSESAIGATDPFNVKPVARPLTIQAPSDGTASATRGAPARRGRRFVSPERT